MTHPNTWSKYMMTAADKLSIEENIPWTNVQHTMFRGNETREISKTDIKLQTMQKMGKAQVEQKFRTGWRTKYLDKMITMIMMTMMMTVYENNDNDDLNLSWSNSKMEKIT